jgi:hypothetical protein
MRQLLLALLCCASAKLSGGGGLTITISGGSWTLGFDEDGAVGSFNVTVGNTGLQLVAPTQQPPGQPALVSVVMGPQWGNTVLGPSQLSLEQKLLHAVFVTPAGNATAVISIGTDDSSSGTAFARFTVVSVAPSALWQSSVSRLRFATIPLMFNLSHCATLAGIGYNDSVAAALLPASLHTSVAALPAHNDQFGPSNPAGAPCSLSASAFSDSGFVNASVALWAGSRPALPAAMQLGEQELGLPSPKLNGGGKLSPELALEVAKGYFLIDIPPSEFNKTVEYAHSAGFGYIVLLDSWIDTTPGKEAKYGHYNVSKAWAGWGGSGAVGTPMAGLRAAVQYANTRGVKIGLHTMSGNIATTDSYVTPIPDVRLATIPGHWTLASDLNATSTSARLIGNTTCLGSIPLSERCTVTDCAPCPGAVTHDIRIGSSGELLTYAHLNTTTGILSGLVRGLHGTQSQSHSAGALVHVMAAGSGPTYLPTGTLIDEIGANIAHVVDAVGADTAYFDGLGNMLPVASGGATERFACSRMQLAFWRACKRQVITQADTEGELELESGHLWHMDDRAGQSDFAATDSKAFLDHIKTVSITRAHRELYGVDLGWWGYLPFTQSYYATTPDEVAYMASRAAGWGGSPALETEFDKLGANGRTAEALASMAPWGKLVFSENISAMLRTPGFDFELVNNSAGWWIRRVQYHPVRIANPVIPASCAWSVKAAFDSSSVGFRLRALPKVPKINAVVGASSDDVDLLALASAAGAVSRTIGCHGQASVVMPGTNPPSRHSGAAAATTKQRGSALTSDQWGPVHRSTTARASYPPPMSPGFINASIVPAPAGAEGITTALRLNYSAVGAPSETSVGCVQNLFKVPLNLTLNRPLSTTVFGDGSHAVLDVQLCAAGGTTCVHYFVAVNHTGWRTVALPLPEARRLFQHPQLCAQNGDNTCITAMRGFTWAAVSEVNLLLTAAPRAIVFVGRIVAQREHPAVLPATTTSITVGDHQLPLPTTLRAKPCLASAPGVPVCAAGEGCADYIECTALPDASSCQAFDATNHRLANTWPVVATATVKRMVRTTTHNGDMLAITVTAGAARAEVTVIERSTELLGPFAERRPPTHPPSLAPPSPGSK